MVTLIEAMRQVQERAKNEPKNILIHLPRGVLRAIDLFGMEKMYGRSPYNDYIQAREILTYLKKNKIDYITVNVEDIYALSLEPQYHNHATYLQLKYGVRQTEE